MRLPKTQSKIHNGMWYKGVIRHGGQATTMITRAASLPGQNVRRKQPAIITVAWFLGL